MSSEATSSSSQPAPLRHADLQHTHVHPNGFVHVVVEKQSSSGRSQHGGRLPAKATELTPLLPSSSSSGVEPVPPSSRLRFWHPSSPSFRFFILTLAMLIPFGPHLVKSSLSSLASYFLNSPSFPLTHAQFGAFQSALSVPNLFIPFLGGLLLDLRGSPSGTVVFLLFTLLGHCAFTVACSLHSFPAAVVSRGLFGLGQGSTVVAQGRIAAVFFRGREMVFAIAVCESLHNLSALIARLYVVPIAHWTGSYVYSLWLGVAACALSLMAGCVFWRMDKHVWREEERLRLIEQERQPAAAAAANAETTVSTEARESDAASSSLLAPGRASPALSTSSSSSSLSSAQDGSEHAARDHSVLSLLSHPSSLPVTFILLCLLHLVHSNSYHLFDYISANFIQHKYSRSVMDSAVLSSLTSCFAIVLCPLAGLVLDHSGYKMYVVCLCSVVTTVAFLLFAFSSLTPYVPLVLLSLSISFVPTILRSAVPDCTPPLLLGTAYGAYEVVESFGAVVGHVGVGLIVDVSGGYQQPLCIFAAMAATSGLLAAAMSVYDRAVGGTLNQKSRRKERIRERKRRREEETRRQQEAAADEATHAVDAKLTQDSSDGQTARML